MSPYIKIYVEILKSCGIEYKIILWDRAGCEEQGESLAVYKHRSDIKSGHLRKIIDFYGYVSFVKQYVISEDYDRLIVFGIPLSVYIASFLGKKYPYKYIFDIRDYSPVYPYFKGLCGEVIGKSFMTIISSNGFLRWLPDVPKYQMCHNYNDPESDVVYDDNKNSEKIIIATIGSIRDYDVNKEVINVFSNDKRFLLRFIGEGPAVKRLSIYVIKNGINNVEFYGKYDKKDEQLLLRGSSILNGMTGMDINGRTLITNRLYLSLISSLPIMVTEGTYQAECVIKYNIGIVLRNDESMKERVFVYMRNLDRKMYQNNLMRYKNHIFQDQNKFKERIKLFLK